MLPSPVVSRLLRGSCASLEPRSPGRGGETSEPAVEDAADEASGVGACREAAGRLPVVKVPSAGLRMEAIGPGRACERIEWCRRRRRLVVSTGPSTSSTLPHVTSFVSRLDLPRLIRRGNSLRAGPTATRRVTKLYICKPRRRLRIVFVRAPTSFERHCPLAAVQLPPSSRSRALLASKLGGSLLASVGDLAGRRGSAAARRRLVRRGRILRRRALLVPLVVGGCRGLRA